MWNKYVWRNKGISLKDFRQTDFSAQFLDDLQFLHKGYNQIESIEIIKTSIIDNTLIQLKYAYEEGVFEDDHVLKRIIKELRIFIDNIDSLLNNGVIKDKEIGKKQFYLNEALFSNTMTLVDNGKNAQVFSVFDNPNIMISSNPFTVQKTKDWFEKIIDNSILISKSNLKRRIIFIKALKDKVDCFEIEVFNSI